MSTLSCYGYITLGIESTKSKARLMQHTSFVKYHLSEFYICNVGFTSTHKHCISCGRFYLKKKKKKEK